MRGVVQRVARAEVRVAAGLRAARLRVAMGEFGAHMEVDLVNDGPVTIVLEL